MFSQFLTKTKFGYLLHFFLIRIIVNLRLTKYLRDPVINWMSDNLKKDDVVIDIGANRGTYAYLMYKLVAKGGAVFAFEPNPYLFQYLQNNLKGTPIKLYQLALSNQVDKVDFYVHIEGASPTSSLEVLDVLHNDRLVKKVSVQSDTLDRVIGSNIKVNLIKVDVEGHEPQVLSGCEEIINLHRPYIIFEYIVGLYNGNVQQMIHKLDPLYKFSCIENNFSIEEIIEISKNNNEKDFRKTQNMNILCTPKY
jgi:FkbM family methyltransferase